MLAFLLKSVPPKRRLRAAAIFLLGLFVLSLFLVDLDAEEELGAPGLRDNPGTAAKTRMSETAASSGPSPLPDFAKGKLATGFKFKVFVYEEDLPRDLYGALRRDARCSNEYSGLEALLPSMIKGLDVYTPYGENADYYVVPVMTECFLKRKLMMGKDFNWAVKDLNSLFEQTLDEIQSSYPHWSRTEGRDHIFVFPSERGPSLLNQANLQRIRKSIFLTGATSYKPLVFEPWKDVVLPTYRWPDKANATSPQGAVEEQAAGEREVLVHFRGAVPGLEDKQPSGLTYQLQRALDGSDLEDREFVFGDLDEDCADLDCVRGEMRRSVFCLCPGGDFEGWSLRLYNAIAAGCIPVILSNKAELPFAQLLDYSRFSVKVAEEDAGRLPEILKGLGRTKIQNKQKELRLVAPRFSWDYASRDASGEAVYAEASALNSLLEILHVKLRFMRNSPYNFWIKEDNA
ncbi:exostosin-like glycosyltransferase [Chloropicon roscoffensis]|uniref:Exostosin-like glycosyltransferase n=1 Tax=Chloropicon roscoffensis TaxID=1461544 RepID=A0AAX4PA82_9CHLO